MRPKHVPQRQCVACGARASQREMVRITIGADGQLSVGAPGRRSGRGAYLCHKPVCWQNVLKGDRLARALRGEIGASGREQIVAYGRWLQQTPSER